VSDFQDAKRVVLEFYREFDAASPGALAKTLSRHITADYRFRGVHPFNELTGSDAVADQVWIPIRRALAPLQRRQDVFMAGASEIDGQVWVCSMGHLLGLSDAEWLGIPRTGKLAFLRYAEFHRIASGRIAETALFCDIVSVMRQAGLTPLPLQTGAEIMTPGPRTHDGLLFSKQDPKEGERTLKLVNAMRGDLFRDDAASPEEVLARTWNADMLWFGPSGIGATYTIGRYQRQHQGPFLSGLSDIQRNGHVSRFAEGHYASWFGWPNLTMSSTGGFLGLPTSDKRLHMRVVDVYRREGDFLAENWIFIDFLYWMMQQNVDVLDRMRRIVAG
jgi:hypothetical protein